MNKLFYPSPNHEPRTEDIKYIVVHGTWMESDKEALERLSCPQAKVSCHYYIDQQGQLIQMVAETQVAWHAGVSAWRDDVSLNKNSIGIEVSVLPHQKFHECQYETLEWLLKDLRERYALSTDVVLAHSDIAPNRKDDPGRGFDWGRLASRDLVLNKPESLDVTNPESLRAFGYVGEDAHILKAAKLRWG
ncbi:MAG: N-acetylmuramoyl-L-alanine amidase [Pseudomonadota bacterium]|nr:N-acetylmuramoyl-L-alanine amidase [Pseudomonadota bacterium]